jgi:UPF0755 protein
LRHRAALSSLAVLAVLGAVAAGLGLYSVYSPRPAGEAGACPVLFTVETGESFSSVAKRLAAIGLVERPRVLVAYAWLRGWDRKVKAGTYSLVAGGRPRDIVEKLVIGQVFKVAVTVPEGFRHAQIAAAIAAATPVDSVSFSELLTDGDALGELGVEGPSLEGYLFPDTYLIPWGMNARRIAAMMKARLDEVLDADLRRRVEELGLTLHETLTLASIIQAETRLPQELPLVSAVYHNRLRRGMRLEADPTVAYALGGYKGRLYYKDLETESPYNTYRIEGLPPGPICAPGKAAILAALYPDTTCRALYFVARGDGGHVFSSTLDEHLRAVESARKARAAPGSK